MAEETNSIAIAAAPAAPDTARPPAVTLEDLTAEQWKTGAAAWLGWLFDGLDMHLYTLVATPFVAELLALPRTDNAVGFYSSWIQAAFLIGWAFGGGFFGVIGDRIGRTRALMLTILTYALFTGMSFFAQTWWQLFIFRFLAALGIGGEWAVGASLLAETWPRRWRPWLAAVLQTAVNLGVVLAGLTVYLMSSLSPRWVFLVGILPALFVLWIRYAVPEPAEWHQARRQTGSEVPRFFDLFGRGMRRITLLSLLVCSLTLTAHWAFLFWSLQQIRNLPDVADWTDAARNQLVGQMMMAGCVTSILGNYLAGGLASKLGYRHAIALMSLGYFGMMFAAYCVPRSLGEMWFWFVAISSFHGIFALFTMYLPPLFPTLLRTTGAGFCYNFGRIVAALGTVFFGTFSRVGDFRLALLYASFLFLPAVAAAWMLPEPPAESTAPV